MYPYRDLNPKPSASETDALPLRHTGNEQNLAILYIENQIMHQKGHFYHFYPLLVVLLYNSVQYGR